MLKMRRDFFEDNRITALKRYPRGDKYVMIFLMLAGLSELDYPRCALVTEDSVPLTKRDLLDIFKVREPIFDEALLLLEAEGMIENINGMIYVNIAGLFEEKEKTA